MNPRFALATTAFVAATLVSLSHAAGEKASPKELSERAVEKMSEKQRQSKTNIDSDSGNASSTDPDKNPAVKAAAEKQEQAHRRTTAGQAEVDKSKAKP